MWTHVVELNMFNNKNKNKNMDSRRWVEHVDQNEAECNEEDDSGGHNVLKELNKKE